MKPLAVFLAIAQAVGMVDTQPFALAEAGAKVEVMAGKAAAISTATPPRRCPRALAE